MKKELSLTAVTFCAFLLGAQTVVFEANSSNDWDQKPEMSAEKVFSNAIPRRLISVKRFPVEKGKKYTLSGEFRSLKCVNPKAFFFGFIAFDKNGRPIEQHHVPETEASDVAVLSKKAGAGAVKLWLKGAENWPDGDLNGRYLAINAKKDGSDLPNYNLIAIKAVRHSEEGIYAELVSPLMEALPAGTVLRIHRGGASYIYAGKAGGTLPEKWTMFSGSSEFDAGSFPWRHGTESAAVILFGGGAGGQMEFRNVKVTAEEVTPSAFRGREKNILIGHSAVIDPSDSADVDMHRVRNLYDGKEDTMWLSNERMDKHDFTIHWYNQAVTAAGIEIDFTPRKYKYTVYPPYLSAHCGITKKDFSGISAVPEKVKIEYKQHGKWQLLAELPVTSEKLIYRFPEKLDFVQRMRISFDSPAGKRVSINELKIAGAGDPTVQAMAKVPALSANGGVFVWHREPAVYPNYGAVKRYFRIPFALKPGKITGAYLTGGAADCAVFYLNGKKLLTPLTTAGGAIIKLARTEVPLELLKDKNILAFEAEKFNHVGGLYAAACQLAICYEDGSIQFVGSGQGTFSSDKFEENWNTSVDGFNHWPPAHTRFGSRSFPQDFWSTDFSEAFLEDKVEIQAFRMTPAVPKDGEFYTMEFDVKVDQPLKNNYALTVRFGDFPVEIYRNYYMGCNSTSVNGGLKKGFSGKTTLKISGYWHEDIPPTLPMRVAVSNGKQQAEIVSKLGKMRSGVTHGQLDMLIGKPEYKIAAGFPDAKIRGGRFYVDGKLRAPFILGDNKFNPGKIADQLKNNGLTIIRTGNNMPVIVEEADRKNFQDNYIEHIRQTADYALRLDPNAKILLTIVLDPSVRWILDNPDEQMEFGDGTRLAGLYNNRGYGNLYFRASMVSEPYQKLIRDSIAELFARLEKEPFANSIIGVAFSAGLAHENNWGVDRYDFARGERSRETCMTGDFGVAARKALVKYLTDKYGSDKAWAESWKLDPADNRISDLKDFKKWSHERIQKILFWRDRPADRFIFRDGRADGRIAEDLGMFLSMQRIEMLLVAGKAVKDATNNRMITGTYLGYVMPQLVNNPAGSSIYSGHAYSIIARQSPYIDFFSSPQWCHAVDLPSFYSVMTDSLGLYGKMYVAEGDIRTHVGDLGSMFDRKNSVAQQRKIHGVYLTKNHGSWLLGWSYSMAGAKGTRFFSDPALIREISSLCEESVKTLPDAPAGTRIAMLVSEHSAFYMDLLSPANTVHATLFYKHFHKFLRTGTGCDIFVLEDLPQLIKSGRLKDYRFVFFFNAYHLNKELRDLIETHVKKDNRTVMFHYAPGFHDDDFNTGKSSLSTAGVASLVGTEKVNVIRKELRLGAAWKNGWNDDCAIWWDRHQKALFYDEIGPVFYLDKEPGMEVLANLRIDGKTQPDKIAAARIRKKDHTVIYVTVPSIPQDMLNAWVRESGTIPVTSGGAIVNVGNGFVSVSNDHQAKDLTLTVQGKYDWFELPGNRKVASGTGSITVPFGVYETKLFRIESR